MDRAHTLAEAIFGGIKVDNCLLMTNDMIVGGTSEVVGVFFESRFFPFCTTLSHSLIIYTTPHTRTIARGQVGHRMIYLWIKEEFKMPFKRLL